MTSFQATWARLWSRDAIRRVERIDVREQFRVSPTWRLLLPLAPAIAIGILMMLPNAAMKQAEASAESTPEIKKQIKTATQKLQERLRETQKKAEEQGLQDSDVLKEINKELDKLVNKDTADRKDALIKINDLAKEIEKRKQELGGADKMRKELDKLKDIAKGPADKMADALKDGDFGKAQEEMKKLNEELKTGKLSKEDQEKLAKQLEANEGKAAAGRAGPEGGSRAVAAADRAEAGRGKHRRSGQTAAAARSDGSERQRAAGNDAAARRQVGRSGARH